MARMSVESGLPMGRAVEVEVLEQGVVLPISKQLLPSLEKVEPLLKSRRVGRPRSSNTIPVLKGSKRSSKVMRCEKSSVSSCSGPLESARPGGSDLLSDSNEYTLLQVSHLYGLTDWRGKMCLSLKSFRALLAGRRSFNAWTACLTWLQSRFVFFYQIFECCCFAFCVYWV